MSACRTPRAPEAEAAKASKPKLITYRTIPPEYRDPAKLPVCDLHDLEESIRERHGRLQVALTDYMTTGALGAAALQADCSPKFLVLQLNRILTKRADGNGIVGWAGLIKGLRINPYTRTAPLPDGELPSPRGRSGAFIDFLQSHEVFCKHLHRLIETGGGHSKSNPSKRPTGKGVATKFIQYLMGQGLTATQYPLNSRSKGRRTIERYIRQYLDTTSSATAVWEGKDVARGRKVGTGLTSFDFTDEIFSLCQLDAHREDCIGTVFIRGSRGLRAIVVNRITFLPVVDLESHAVCGYTVTIRPEAAGRHVEEALLSCTRRWKPRDLKIAGLSYMPGGGFPVGCVEGLEEVRAGALSMDNATINYSRVVAEKARKVFGCATTWGSIGGWWRRAVIERFFGILEQHGFKRLPSSMGKGPHDPLRDDPVGHAVENGIEWDELLDLLDVLLAEFNGTPLDALDYRSPLDYIRGRMQARSDTWVPRPPVNATLMTPPLGTEIEYVHIRGEGQKNPYVQLDEVPYNNELLALRRDWVGREVALHIPQDIRTLQVFHSSGEPLGEVTCLERRWRGTAHSRDIRKTINALSRDGDLYVGPDEDAVVVYAKHLATKAYEAAGKGPPRVSKDGTALAELSRTTGVAVPDVSAPPAKTPPQRSLPPGFAELAR